MSDEALQLWVRNDKGQVFGPLTATSVELLLDNGVLLGRIQVSTDGIGYVFPGRMPGVRMVFPRELWGDNVAPPDPLDEAFKNVVPPPAMPGAAPPAGSSPSVVAAGAGPMSGPGIAQAQAAARAAPTAGPGVRAQAGYVPNPSRMQQRPVSSSPSQVGIARPPGVAGPPQGIPSGSQSGVRVAPSSSASQVGVRPTASQLGDALFSDALPTSSSNSGLRPVVSSVSGLRPASSVSGVRAVPQAGSVLEATVLDAEVIEAEVVSTPAPRPTRPPVGHTPDSAPTPPPGMPTPAPARGPRVPAIQMPSGELPPSGDLSSASVMRLYFLAASTDATGLLQLKLKDRALSLHFRKGNPDFLDSNHPDESIGAFLIKSGLATLPQLKQAEDEKAQFGGELLPALFGLGLLNPGVVFTHLVQRATAILSRALMAEQGTFTWEPKELPGSKAMPIGNRWSMYAEQLRKANPSEIQRRMQAVMNNPVMKSGGAVGIENMKLTPQETRALNFFDGVRSLAQLVTDLPAEADTIVRTAWMLRDCDTVSFSGVEVAAPPPRQQPQQVIAPPPPPDGRPPTITAQVAPPQVAAPVSKPAAPAVAPAKPVSQPAAQAVKAPGPAGAEAAAPPSGAKPAAPAAGTKPAAPAAGAKPAAPAAGAKPGAPAAGTKPGAPAAGTKPGAPTAGTKPAAAPGQPVVKPDARTGKVQIGPDGPVNFKAEAAKLALVRDKMLKQTHFEVLGIAKDSDGPAAKVAYFKAARSYHPDTVPPEAPPELGAVKADIFARIGDAYRTLSDPRLRAEYLADLEVGGTGEKVDVAALLAAEELFQKSTILVKARKFADAVKMLDEAIEANDAEPEFLAWRGYARFFAAADKKAAHSLALRDIDACLAKNPRIAQAFYFRGFMAKTLGDEAAAKRDFKKCVELDSKHVDAQRELRLMK